MSVTLKEIARHTGLSVPTVGNVLGRASSRYSDETRRRVQEAAREMGYKPNSSARAIRQGRIGSAALVLSRSHQSVLSHVPTGLLDGLDDELGLHDMHLTVSRLTDEQLSRDDFVPKVLREFMADGMIVNYTHEIPPRMLDLIRAHHSPAVWVNAKLPGDCVYPDDRTGAETATARLIAAGHRRITLIHLVTPRLFPPGTTFDQTVPGAHYSVADRKAGYRAAMAGAGLAEKVLYDDRFVHEDDSVAACPAALAGPDGPTAVLLYSEVESAPLLLAARSLGLRVPQDLMVLEFSPQRRQVADVHLAVAEIPTHEIGRQAVRMLMRKIASPDEELAPVVVPYGPLDEAAIAPPGKDR